MIEEHDSGRTKQAIVVIRAATETAWFQDLWQFPICFVRGRIEFVPGVGAAAKVHPLLEHWMRANPAARMPHD